MMSANKRLLPSGVASPSSFSTSTSSDPSPPTPFVFTGFTFFTSGAATGCGPVAAGQLS